MFLLFLYATMATTKKSKVNLECHITLRLKIIIKHCTLFERARYVADFSHVDVIHYFSCLTKPDTASPKIICKNDKCNATSI